MLVSPLDEAAAAVELDVIRVVGESLNNDATAILPSPLVTSATMLISCGREVFINHV